jgi:hypothetical protein
MTQAANAVAGPSRVWAPQLDEIPNDPILTPSLPNSPSRARAGGGIRPSMLARGNSTENLAVVSEDDPLLGRKSDERRRKPFYRPRPLWCVPISSTLRGALRLTQFY